MRSYPLVVISLTGLILAGCQTPEEIRREKMVEAMHGQLGQSQKLNAEFTNQMEEFEKRLNKMQGRMEELDHQSSEGIKNGQERMSSSLAQTQEQVRLLSEQVKEMKNAIEEQRSFIEKVTHTLSNVSESAAPSKKAKKKEQEAVSEPARGGGYDEAMALYKAGKYKSALPLLENLADDKKLDKNERSRVIHGAGYIKFIKKDSAGALASFSRLYSELPDSIMAASSLLHLGKIFEQEGQKSEAKSAYQELLTKFPKSKHASQAKEALEKL